MTILKGCTSVLICHGVGKVKEEGMRILTARGVPRADGRRGRCRL